MTVLPLARFLSQRLTQMVNTELLFILYTLHFCNIIQHNCLHFYADDVQLYISNKSIVFAYNSSPTKNSYVSKSVPNTHDPLEETMSVSLFAFTKCEEVHVYRYNSYQQSCIIKSDSTQSL